MTTTTKNQIRRHIRLQSPCFIFSFSVFSLLKAYCISFLAATVLAPDSATLFYILCRVTPWVSTISFKFWYSLWTCPSVFATLAILEFLMLKASCLLMIWNSSSSSNSICYLPYISSFDSSSSSWYSCFFECRDPRFFVLAAAFYFYLLMDSCGLSSSLFSESVSASKAYFSSLYGFLSSFDYSYLFFSFTNTSFSRSTSAFPSFSSSLHFFWSMFSNFIFWSMSLTLQQDEVTNKDPLTSWLLAQYHLRFPSPLTSWF